MKHIIVGGVAGGATAAARIRRIDEHAEIIMFEKGNYISYANCGLPYYIGDVINEREKLFLQTPQSFGKRFEVDVRVNSEVIKINPATKEVTIKTGNETYSENYDKLLLSPGAFPVRPPLAGIDMQGIFTLRNVADTDNIKNYVTKNKIENAIVIGGGFIGLEMAENLHQLGAHVSIVEMAKQVMTPVDFQMANMVHEHLNQKGVDLFLEETVTEFKKSGNKIDVIFKSGKSLNADIVILSIGVRPDTVLAKDAGLKTGVSGGIWVDEYLQTSEKDIYAVGDAIEFPHPITGQSWLNYLAVPANRQGRIVADNMVLGNTLQYEGAIGTAIAKVFDLTVTVTGMNEKYLNQQNIKFATSTTITGSNAGYYPGAVMLTTKINFDPESGKIYGAQIVGAKGVDKRIDQIALLIKHGRTTLDLTKLEHAYAPPFSSAKDPIAIAGYVAQNIVTKKMPVVYWQDMLSVDTNNIFLLDVRTPEEFRLGTIDGAVNIEVDELRYQLDKLPKDKTIYIFCAVGLRGYLATNILLQNGFSRVYNLSGGYKTYQAATYKIVNKGKTATDTTRPVSLNLDTQTVQPTKHTIRVDACGMQCPGPLMKMKNSMDNIAYGDRLEIVATDRGFMRDSQAWCNLSGNRLISQTEKDGQYTVVIEKTSKEIHPDHTNPIVQNGGKGKTFIVFSDDLDKALASFVLANGAAAATNEKVSIFFTFWGLNVIKKLDKPLVKKDFMGKMFGMMLPSSSKKLKLSKLNMMGMGSKMMRNIMKNKNIESLEALRQQAIDNGVEFIACQMSMDVMGIKREELLDNVIIGGVATYMERADNANVNMFI